MATQLTPDELFELALENAKSDRKQAKGMVTALMQRLLADGSEHNFAGPVLGKYLDCAHKSNEQIIKIGIELGKNGPEAEEEVEFDDSMYDEIKEAVVKDVVPVDHNLDNEEE